MNTLTFIINEQEKFTMNLDCPENIIHSCNFSNLVLIINNETITIGKSIIDDYAQILKTKLTLALSNKLKLHSSIKKNIGYYWNQDLNEDDPDLVFNSKKGKSWVGNIYFLWATDNSKKYERFATWLYNDEAGNIIFEVTPTYPDTFIDPEDPADVVAYQEWMEKSYQPFFTRIISQDLALQWLDQVNLILKIIKENAENSKSYEA
ncbi:hypothetical protein KBC04_01960 [Candidatus Babeliales bacterium]|nr:hypothetical protein [Candidatus Babeliales bacterium]MBP9843826.1 hypothetical protein [Candidatus Babeliales bacterium]